MSLASLLSIARTALVTHQRALNVTAHNVANAQTPGYTRQRLNMIPATPLRTPQGLVGRGVADYGIFADRDTFLDAAFRRENGLSGRSTTLRDMLSQVEGVFGEPSETGLGAALDALWDAFSDLANDPSSNSARTLVQQAGRQLARQVNQTDTRLQAISDQLRFQLESQVGDVNAYAQEIAALNKQIQIAGGPLHTAPDLEDQRNLLVDKLSSLINVRVLDRADGTIGLVAGDTLLVDGQAAQQLEVRSVAGGGWGVALQGGVGLIDPGSGSLSALTELSTSGIPAVRGDLDQLVEAIVAQVNAVHQTGFTPGGVTGTDFFDPAGITARTMALAAPVEASVAEIAAGATAAPGDGAIALQIAQLRTTTIPALGATAGEYYVGLVAGVGTLVREADQQASASNVLAQNMETRRSSVSGVSLDEEMVALIVQQQAYAAATRLVRVADETMDALLSMV